MKRVFAGLGLMALLTACDGGGDPVEQALRDASAANHAAKVREGTVSNPVPTRAVGSEDELWVARMIEHHRAAVTTAEIALARSRDPEVRRIAEAVRTSRAREIAEMQAWTPSTDPAS